MAPSPSPRSPAPRSPAPRSPSPRSPELYLLAERPCYACPASSSWKKEPPGWDSMTQVRGMSFDGLRSRPYTSQLSGSPLATARSGARSLAAWQRDYNVKGRIEEKVKSLRHEQVFEMNRKAVKEAARRKLPVEAVKEEMYQAQKAASKRIDTGLRKIEMSAPLRAQSANGGPPRLFDGNVKLEDNFTLRDAQEMFRGDAWELMSETLESLTDFKPPPRSLEKAQQSATNRRGSFSSGVTPAELNKAISNATKDEAEIGTAELERLKQFLVIKYGTLWAAWRNALISDGVVQLSFALFRKAVKVLGFEGNVKAIWKQLDNSDSGFAGFAELDPSLASRISIFRDKAMAASSGSWTKFWKVVDKDKSDSVDLQEFMEACQNIGYVDNPADLFKTLRTHPSRNFLNLEDFKAIPKDWKAMPADQ